MPEEIPSIDDMPHLKARLGKARTDRIRYAGQEDPSKQKYVTNIANTVLDSMQFVSLHKPGCPVTDILTGAAWLDPSQAKPLSVDRLFNLFQCVQTINAREVMKMMAVDQRQARRYVRAAKFALPHLETQVKAEAAQHDKEP